MELYREILMGQRKVPLLRENEERWMEDGFGVAEMNKPEGSGKTGRIQNCL